MIPNRQSPVSTGIFRKRDLIFYAFRTCVFYNLEYTCYTLAPLFCISEHIVLQQRPGRSYVFNVDVVPGIADKRLRSAVP